MQTQPQPQHSPVGPVTSQATPTAAHPNSLLSPLTPEQQIEQLQAQVQAQQLQLQAQQAQQQAQLQAQAQAKAQAHQQRAFNTQQLAKIAAATAFRQQYAQAQGQQYQLHVGSPAAPPATGGTAVSDFKATLMAQAQRGPPMREPASPARALNSSASASSRTPTRPSGGGSTRLVL